IKVVLALRHREIPRHLHLRELNPHIAREGYPIRIPVEPMAWKGTEPRLAGVSSFGLSGINAHVVVEEAPAAVAAFASGNGKASPVERPAQVLALSAKGAEALRDVAGRYAAWLVEHPEANLADVAFTANSGRSHFEHRAALVISSADQA